MPYSEVLLISLPKRTIDDLLTQHDLHVVGSRMEESGYLILFEGQPNNICEFIVEAANMELFLAQMFDEMEAQ